MASPNHKIKYSSQEIDNMSFDETYKLSVFQQFKTPIATKITEGTGVTYFAEAPVGSALGSAVWRVRKIEESGSDTIITWADSGNYTQTAIDLTGLTYS